MPRLTMRFVESLTFNQEKGKIQYYRDDQIQGFGLMVQGKINDLLRRDAS